MPPPLPMRAARAGTAAARASRSGAWQRCREQRREQGREAGSPCGELQHQLQHEHESRRRGRTARRARQQKQAERDLGDPHQIRCGDERQRRRAEGAGPRRGGGEAREPLELVRRQQPAKQVREAIGLRRHEGEELAAEVEPVEDLLQSRVKEHEGRHPADRRERGALSVALAADERQQGHHHQLEEEVVVRERQRPPEPQGQGRQREPRRESFRPRLEGERCTDRRGDGRRHQNRHRLRHQGDPQPAPGRRRGPGGADGGGRRARGPPRRRPRR